jgi:hypothetical protein
VIGDTNNPTPRRNDPAKLIEWWEKAVTEVENGYSSGIDEYVFDLGQTRDTLEHVISNLPPEIAQEWRSKTDILDERFKAATTADVQNRLSSYFRSGTEWWWSRIPILGPLADYLAEADDS